MMAMPLLGGVMMVVRAVADRHTKAEAEAVQEPVVLRVWAVAVSLPFQQAETEGMVRLTP